MDSIFTMPLIFPDSGGDDLCWEEQLAIVVGLIVFYGVVMHAQELVTRIRRKRSTGKACTCKQCSGCDGSCCN